MTERVLAGVPASPGTALGAVRRLDTGSEIDGTVLEEGNRPAAAARARNALAQSARELEELAATLRARGGPRKRTSSTRGTMMAEDPTLLEAVERAVLTRGLDAASAILVEVEAVAAQLDMLGDPELAARAADIRSIGRRAWRLASSEPGATSAEPPATRSWWHGISGRRM